MEPGRSRTVEIPAVMRALHQRLDDDPKIQVDPVAPRLITHDVDDQWLAPFLDHPFAKQWRAGFALRARYAEDCLAQAARRGVTQYVVLGAGLDTFAYRQPSWGSRLQIYEVDDPATQQWKRDRLREAKVALPANLRFVSIDFETATIADGLKARGFAADEKTTCCSWMGVMQYLTTDAVDAVFRFVRSLPRSSEIVFSFIVPPEAVSGLEADALALAAERAATAGEPWLTRPDADELRRTLRTMGFSEVIHFNPEQARESYFAGRQDGLRERHGEQLMRAIV
jgi:methyltransferase (TIGR00027 family)